MVKALGSTRLRPDVYKSWLTGPNYCHCFPDCRSKLCWILDWSLRPPAHRLCEFMIFDVRIHDAGANWPQIIAQICNAIAEVGEPLHVHELLMVAPVIVHHGEERNLMLCCRPQHARRVHQIAV